eukprot:835527-Amphidinium_carterae.1
MVSSMMGRMASILVSVLQDGGLSCASEGACFVGLGKRPERLVRKAVQCSPNDKVGDNKASATLSPEEEAAQLRAEAHAELEVTIAQIASLYVFLHLKLEHRIAMDS